MLRLRDQAADLALHAVEYQQQRVVVEKCGIVALWSQQFTTTKPSSSRMNWIAGRSTSFQALRSAWAIVTKSSRKRILDSLLVRGP